MFDSDSEVKTTLVSQTHTRPSERAGCWDGITLETHCEERKHNSRFEIVIGRGEGSSSDRVGEAKVRRRTDAGVHTKTESFPRIRREQRYDPAGFEESKE